ncbi:MAG: hypothetical protein JXD23_08800 [Spirochaetales bacterium]|nr:hypothetical protein [Spirochaetales bacterium]
MTKNLFLLCIAALFCSAPIYSQTVKNSKEMSVQDAIYKAIQLDTTIQSKKTALEKDKDRHFKKFDDDFNAGNRKLKNEKKGEFETTKEFNARIEDKRVKLATELQDKKDAYMRDVYNEAVEKDIASMENELDELTGQPYKVSDSYYKIIIDRYNADGGYYPVTFSYYVRTDVNKATGKKTYVWDKEPFKWEIERDKAKAIASQKDSLILDCRASIYKVSGSYVYDKYEISIADPETKDVLFNSVFWRNKKLSDRPSIRTPSGGFVVLSITCSSLLTEKRDRNMYQPAKVFDGKPDTGWAESAPGSGNGEWIEIRFARPVTADKIVVSPGWFDKRYWILNNRIKSLSIELDDYGKEARFKDQMIPQDVSLSGEKTFTRARFVVRDVYRTAKDDDTCIAEIEFLIGNKKIDLDLSACADQMKVIPE